MFLFQEHQGKFILCFVLTVMLALACFLLVVLVRHFRPPGGVGGGGLGRRRANAPSPPLSTDLDTVDCDPDMQIIIRTPLPEPTFLSNAAQYGVVNTSGGGSSGGGGDSAVVRYPTLGRGGSSRGVQRNSHHGGESLVSGAAGCPMISPTPPRDTVVRYSTIGRHRISPSGGSVGGGGQYYAGGMASGAPMYAGNMASGAQMYASNVPPCIYAPGSAYSGVSNHSSYLDADLADPRSLTRSQNSDLPYYD